MSDISKDINAYLARMGCMNFAQVKEFSNLCRDYFERSPKLGNYYGMYCFGLQFCLPMPVSFNKDFKALFLDITKLDDYFMQEYKDEYPQGMGMKTFMDKKWGSEVTARFERLIGYKVEAQDNGSI